MTSEILVSYCSATWHHNPEKLDSSIIYFAQHYKTVWNGNISTNISSIGIYRAGSSQK